MQHFYSVQNLHCVSKKNPYRIIESSKKSLAYDLLTKIHIVIDNRVHNEIFSQTVRVQEMIIKNIVNSFTKLLKNSTFAVQFYLLFTEWYTKKRRVLLYISEMLPVVRVQLNC